MSDEVEAEPKEPAPPRKRKKKKKTGPAAGAKEEKAKEPAYPLPFAQRWPVDSELLALAAAFERGDYAFVRERAPEVAKTTKDPRVKAAALDLRRRIDPDPVAGLLVIVAIGLLCFLAFHYLGHREPEASGQPHRPAMRPSST